MYFFFYFFFTDKWIFKLFIAAWTMPPGAELTLGRRTLWWSWFYHQNIITFFFIWIALLKRIDNELTWRYEITIFYTLLSFVDTYFLDWCWFVSVLDFETFLSGCTKLVDFFYENFSHTWDCFLPRIHFIFFSMWFYRTMMFTSCKCTFTLITSMNLKIGFGQQLVIVIINLTFNFQSRNIKIGKITPFTEPCCWYQKPFTTFSEIYLVDAT